VGPSGSRRTPRSARSIELEASPPLSYGTRARLFIALATAGIATAVYHAYGEITFTLSACSLTKAFSCAAVFASGYTTVLGVEFWVYGVVWFPVCLVLGLWVIQRDGVPSSSILAPFLMIGNIFTIYPWYIEVTLLRGVYCPVCISLYCMNYLMTAVALLSRTKAP